MRVFTRRYIPGISIFLLLLSNYKRNFNPATKKKF